MNTPFIENGYEGHHLQIRTPLEKNIEYHHYVSGRMIYADEELLTELHADVAAFIRRIETVLTRQLTDNVKLRERGQLRGN